MQGILVHCESIRPGSLGREVSRPTRGDAGSRGLKYGSDIAAQAGGLIINLGLAAKVTDKNVLAVTACPARSTAGGRLYVSCSTSAAAFSRSAAQILFRASLEVIVRLAEACS